MLKAGDHAPDVELTGPDDRPFRLSALLEKGPVVLYFYPKDDTRVCTREACTFRDNYPEFTGLGASVVGVSDDDAASHQRFATKHGLPFLLLSDPGGKAREAFGLRLLFGSKARATFVIDGEGAVRAVISDRLNAGRHVRKALEALHAHALTGP
jgi:peroxiredoxin Q/BCP